MKRLLALLACIALSACASTDNLQLSNGGGKSFSVSGRSYAQIWQAATLAMSNDIVIVESHRPSGVIKSRVVNGTPGKVVGFFIQPTDASSPRYTVTIVSRKSLQTQFVDRDWEPSVVEDFKQALDGKRNVD
jgi:hypothetical protein